MRPLGEVDVFYNAEEKPTQKVKENKETEICVLNKKQNKTKPQKNMLMKER